MIILAISADFECDLTHSSSPFDSGRGRKNKLATVLKLLGKPARVSIVGDVEFNAETYERDRRARE